MTAKIDDTESAQIEAVQGENRHLKNTIIALRQELENEGLVQASRAQTSTVEVNDEVVQLKATINSLRDTLELVRAQVGI